MNSERLTRRGVKPNSSGSKKMQQVDNQFRVLRSLERNPQVSQRELAASLGLSLGAVNYCLKALVAKGWVKVENFKGNSDKAAYAYLLTSRGLREKTRLTKGFLQRKLVEYHALQQEIEELQGEMGKNTKRKKNSQTAARATGSC